MLGDIVERQGEQIGETREALTWDIIRAGTSVQYGGRKTQRTAVDKTSVFNTALVRSTIAELHRQKAKKISRVLSPSAKYETYPVEAAYVAFGHTDLIPTLRELAGTSAPAQNHFTTVSNYGTRTTLSPNEFGSFEEVRYIASPDLSPHKGAGATTAGTDQPSWYNSPKPTDPSMRGYDVYPTVVIGREAYGCIALRGKRAVTPVVMNPNIPRGGDPLGQKGWSGWKMYYACVRLNEAWMRRIESAAAK